LAGNWYDARNAHSVVLKSDGTYATMLGDKGTFSRSGERVVFNGSLASMGGGVAFLEGVSSFEFRWTDASGVFQRVRFDRVPEP
jgi:hypothetical protein